VFSLVKICCVLYYDLRHHRMLGIRRPAKKLSQMDSHCGFGSFHTGRKSTQMVKNINITETLDTKKCVIFLPNNGLLFIFGWFIY